MATILPTGPQCVIGSEEWKEPVDLAHFLQRVLAVSPRRAQSALERICIYPDLKRAAESLVQGHEPKDLVERGISYRDLVTRYGISPVGALLMLSWIRRDSKAAWAALQSRMR